MRKSIVALSCVVGMLVSFGAEGATILIDLGTTGNQTGVDGNGNQWNNLTGANADNITNPRTGTIPLVDITNSGALGISMEYAYPDTGDNFADKDATSHGSLPALTNLGLLDVQSAKQDVLWSDGNVTTPTLTFTGLDADSKYSFKIFSYRAQTGRTSFFQLAGSTTSANVEINVDTSNVAPGTVLQFSDFMPDGSNEIVLTNSPGTGGFAYFSALQIDVVTPVVPEPSSFILLGLGLIGLVRKTRNRRQRK